MQSVWPDTKYFVNKKAILKNLSSEYPAIWEEDLTHNLNIGIDYLQVGRREASFPKLRWHGYA